MTYLLAAADPPDASKWMAVGISFVALLVSGWGVWDRRRDTKRQIQVRLSELVDELNKANVEQEMLLEEAKRERRSPAAINRQYNGRREMLTYEAVGLIEDGSAAPTAQQCLTIANAAWRYTDAPIAESMWKRGISLSRPGQAVRTTLLRGYAGYYFENADPEKGSQLFRQAQSEESGEGFASLWRQAETYLHWAVSEASRGPAARSDCDELLRQAEACFEAVGTRSTRLTGRDRLKEARERIEPLLSAEDEHSERSEAAEVAHRGGA